MRRASILLVLAALGCSRDLGMPARDQVAVSPGFAVAAPRERLTLNASGGASGYQFSFAAGGQLSGPDADVTASGLYQAGALGSAQDVVLLTDRAGGRALARITVGPRLAITPGLTATAPGGQVAFVASGGKPPYTFSLDSPVVGSSVVAGDYRAGPTGDVVERVRVTDATADAGAVAIAEVHVGAALKIYRGSSGEVAPGESVNLVALGGQPPYVYSMAAAPSGATIDPTTGAYRAGPTGSVTDVVQALDANGTAATAQVPVGAPLTLSLAAATPRPGEPTKLVAHAGKPPYAFAFRPKGNRSHGVLDPITGAFTPGTNFGAVDLVQVTDATATVVALDLPPVGPVRLQLGLGVNACVATDFTGDGLTDLAFFQDQQITTFIRPRSAAPVQETLFYNVIIDQVLAGDFNGDAHGEVVMMQGGSLAALVPDLSGHLSLARATDGKTYVGPLGFVAEMAAPLYTGLETDFVTSEFFSGGGPRIVTWSNSQPGPNAAVSAVASGGPTASPQLVALAAGDFDGDGRPDLAWLYPTPFYPNSSGPLWMAFGAGSTVVGSAFTNKSPSPGLPAGMTYSPSRASRYSTFAAIPNLAFGRNLLAVLKDGTGRNRLALAKGTGQTPTWGTPIDPFPGDPAGVAGVTGFFAWAGTVVGDVKIVAWDEVDGRVAGLSYDVAGNLVVAARAPVPDAIRPGFPVTCATAGDVNGDGFADLVLASTSSPTAEIYWADGDGGYGRHARFGGVGVRAVADVDGDGLADVITATAGPGLAVLFGGDHQLAWQAETPVAQPIATLAAGNFLGDGRQSVLYQEKGGAFRLAPGASDGTFGAATSLAVTSPNGTSFTSPLQSLATAVSAAGAVPSVFGGDASGFHAIRLSSQAAATHLFAAKPAAGTTCSYSPAGLGIGRVVAFCDTASGSTLFVSTLAGSGAGEGYSAFVVLQAWTGSNWVLPAGQLPDGSAVFLNAQTDIFAVTAPPSGAPLRSNIGTYASLFTFLPSSAALGAVDADGVPDLVASEPYGKTVVLRGLGGGAYSRLAGYPAAGTVFAVARLAAGSGSDVLLLAGSDVAPLVNDGTGNLR